MSQPLPVSDFQWMEKVDGFDVETIADDAEIGYILEVDLEYPPEIHEAHSDYLLALEIMKITGR